MLLFAGTPCVALNGSCCFLVHLGWLMLFLGGCKLQHNKNTCAITMLVLMASLDNKVVLDQRV